MLVSLSVLVLPYNLAVLPRSLSDSSSSVSCCCVPFKRWESWPSSSP